MLNDNDIWHNFTALDILGLALVVLGVVRLPLEWQATRRQDNYLAVGLVLVGLLILIWPLLDAPHHEY